MNHAVGDDPTPFVSVQAQSIAALVHYIVEDLSVAALSGFGSLPVLAITWRPQSSIHAVAERKKESRVHTVCSSTPLP